MMTKTNERGERQATLHALLEENSEKLLTCVHCGLCLPACPTYRQLGSENDSPRGRIYLMRGVVEGRMSVSRSFISHIDLCLGCRACETVCPSGVPYGHLLEAARGEVSLAKSERGQFDERVLRFVLNRVFTRPRVLSALMAGVRWLRDSGLAQMAFEANLVGGRARFALALLLSSRSALRLRTPRPAAEASMSALRVAVFRGCVMEGLFRETNRATEAVVSSQDCNLVQADGQACCGALHAHAGQIASAKQLARRNIDALADAGTELIVVNAAGCGAAMKEYGELLADDPDYCERAQEFSARVRDISEFLSEVGILAPQNRVECRVAYDAPCHLYHAQRITQAPVDLLQAIPGVELVPLPGAESCCGGAGLYNLQHPDLSGAILDDKITNILASGAELVATANPGCIMQIGAGLLLAGSKTRVVHPIEMLYAAQVGLDPVH